MVVRRFLKSIRSTLVAGSSVTLIATLALLAIANESSSFDHLASSVCAGSNYHRSLRGVETSSWPTSLIIDAANEILLNSWLLSSSKINQSRRSAKQYREIDCFERMIDGVGHILHGLTACVHAHGCGLCGFLR
jgi:hypothetical protein